MSDIKDFHTRETANKGIDLPLYLPDGSKSEHSITIRGVDSDAFRAAEAQASRRAFEEASEGKEPDIEAGKRDMLASLIISWTFDQKCTIDARRNLLREAPQIADAIDRVASQRRFFTSGVQPNSTPTPKRSSSSRARPKDQK